MSSRHTRSLSRLACVALVAGLAAGCAPMVERHGYTPLPQDLAEIQPGVDTRATVARKVGRPATSSTFTDRAWYYVSSRVERLTYHAPETTDRRVVQITFSPQGVVTDINEYGLEDGRDIRLATQTTPTHGRQLTILQQAFGNIGVMTGNVFDDEEVGPDEYRH